MKISDVINDAEEFDQTMPPSEWHNVTATYDEDGRIVQVFLDDQEVHRITNPY